MASIGRQKSAADDPHLLAARAADRPSARSAVPVQTSRIHFASPPGATSSTVRRRQRRSIPSESRWFNRSYRPAIWPNIWRMRAEDLSSVTGLAP